MHLKILAYSLAVVIFSSLAYSPVFAERKVFKSDLSIEKLKAGNLGVEEIPETGDYRIYYRNYDGEIDSIVFRPSTKVDVIVKSTVESKPEALTMSSSEHPPVYLYQYTIESLKTSRQPVRAFRVMMQIPKGTQLSIMAPDDWHFRGPKPKHAVNSVFFGASSHGNTRPEVYIHPGQSLKHFAIEAPGLPGILTAYITGQAKPWTGTEAVELPLGLKHKSVHGRIVGPVPVPEDFQPVKFAARLESLFLESVELGWISNERETQPLLDVLKSLQTALSSNKVAQARSQILEFLAILKLKSKTENILTSEATSMLKINAQYLLGKL
ncbi:MAG: hypothetical protein OXP71_04430 [Candidatus Poribacteria bacterium]|nr:hypothetical protein [Candidatus Poribacteria bacterium]